MRTAAKFAGLTAFVLTEAAALFGSYVVASVRCCGTAAAVGPASASEWAALLVFALVMVIPAAIIGVGAAMIADGIARGIDIITARRRER